jgi:hypothetical protein
MHRTIVFAFTGVVAACIAAPAFAAPAAPVIARAIAKCEALEAQRPSGGRSHQQFLADCLRDDCEAISEQRGSGITGPELREHERFMRQCVAGKIPQ